jgi:RNA polymerase sigma factor (sigma-70 family)
MERRSSFLMEASTIQSAAALCPTRVKIGPRLLRLRSDEQLVALFRAGHDEAFQVIYDRYHKRLEGYARRMLPGAHDAEDVLQEVFVRAYRALLTGDRELAVKAWLFRIVHNRCIDELRRTTPPVVELLDNAESHNHDPASQVDARDSLRRLLEDIRRLPEQQRSALLLRELSGISYAEVASVLDTSVPAVKSLLVRARMGLVRASEARDTACSEIREQLAEAHEQGVRASSTVRNHLRDCQACRSYRREIFLVRKRVAALAPVGPLAALAKLVGLPGGGATGTGGAGSAAALTGGGAASGAAIGAGHMATLLAAAIASAGGAVGLQHVIGLSGQSPPRAASVTHRAHASNHSTAGVSSATASSQSRVSTGATAGAAGGSPGASGGLGGSSYDQDRSGAGTPATGDSLIATSDSGTGQGQTSGTAGTTGTAGGTTGTQPWSIGSGSTSGSTGSTTSGSSGTPTAGPGSSEGAGVGVTPPAATGDGTTGTGSTTSTGTTTTAGGTTGSTTGTGSTSSSTGTAGDVTDTGQGTTTTPTSTDGSSSGQTSSGSTTTTGTIS